MNPNNSSLSKPSVAIAAVSLFAVFLASPAASAEENKELSKSESVAIPFEKREIKTNGLSKGVSVIVQTGEPGELEISYVRNGDRAIIQGAQTKQERISKQPISEVKLIGTGAIIPGVSEEIIKKNLEEEQKIKKKKLEDEEASSNSDSESFNLNKEEPGKAKTDSIYTLKDLMFQGVINWNGYKFTYYSQSVLPGPGLAIPGRHVNSGGFVADKDGYIVLANDSPKGSVIETPFGAKGKVYDRGTSGNHYDVYTK